MPYKIVTVPCRTDNYAFLIHDADTGATAVVDVPETAPIVKALADHGWALTDILITHHHDDHIAGVDALKSQTGARVVGATADAHRLPALDLSVAEGDAFQVGNAKVVVLDVSGHTVGHIAFYIETAQAVFTADSLMALGCGRLFEGTPEMMWRSLQKLARLPESTKVYSGHEYTAANAQFAVSIEPHNPALISRVNTITSARALGKPTVPSTIREELDTNPFLRAGLSNVKDAVGLPEAEDVAVFAEIRAQKDRF